MKCGLDTDLVQQFFSGQSSFALRPLKNRSTFTTTCSCMFVEVGFFKLGEAVFTPYENTAAIVISEKKVYIY